MLKYKGYTGHVELDDTAGLFHERCLTYETSLRSRAQALKS